MELGKNISKIRKDNNLTQDDFAEKYFVTRQTISNWEIGKTYPDLETIVKISNDFNISLDILLKEDNKMVKEIDKGVKGAKKYKNILKYIIVFFSLILFIFLVYVLMFLNFKKTVIDKFDEKTLNYNFKKSNHQWYHLNNGNSIIYTILNPFPNFFDFKLNYENKLLDCTIITGDELKDSNGNGAGWSSSIQIHWTNDGRLSMQSFACENWKNSSTTVKDSKGNRCGYYGLKATYEIDNDSKAIENINFDEVSKKLNVDKDILTKAVIEGTKMYNDLYE